MIANRKVVAVIPARSGSKRLKNKNKKLFSGKPLISIAIEEALKSVHIDQVLVTTDDTEIINIASCLNVDYISRPDFLCTDNAKSMDVILHSIDVSDLKNDDIVVLLQPTSPLRTAEHINKAIDEYVNKKAVSIISVCETEHSPLWSNTLPISMNMAGFIKEEVKGLRSQELPTYYRINGAIYISSVENLRNTGSYFNNERAYAFCMEQEASIDIDTELDFDFAEFIYKKLK
jgi:CMP-N,N'-diacetyllegionaminic acid synthase